MANIIPLKRAKKDIFPHMSVEEQLKITFKHKLKCSANREITPGNYLDIYSNHDDCTYDKDNYVINVIFRIRSEINLAENDMKEYPVDLIVE